MTKHTNEGRKRRCREAYVAMVEGHDHGVPFRTFYKRIGTAERDAMETGGVLTDLRTLSRRRFVNNNWKEC